MFKLQLDALLPSFIILVLTETLFKFHKSTWNEQQVFLLSAVFPVFVLILHTSSFTSSSFFLPFCYSQATNTIQLMPQPSPDWPEECKSADV